MKSGTARRRRRRRRRRRQNKKEKPRFRDPITDRWGGKTQGKKNIQFPIPSFWFGSAIFNNNKKRVDSVAPERHPSLVRRRTLANQKARSVCRLVFYSFFKKFIQSPYWIKAIPYLRSDFGNVHKEKPGKNPVKLARARHLRTTRERIRTAFVFFCLFFCRSGHHHPLLLISSSFFFTPRGPTKKKAQKDEENEEQKKTKERRNRRRKKKKQRKKKKSHSIYYFFFQPICCVSLLRRTLQTAAKKK